MQSEESGDCRDHRRLAARHVFSRHDIARIGIHSDHAEIRPAMAVTRILSVQHGFDGPVALEDVADVLHPETGRLPGKAADEKVRGQECHTLFRIDMMLRLVRFEHGRKLAAIGNFVLQAVKLVVKGEHDRRQGHDDMERQAENAEHIVYVEPHALQILPDPERKDVLREPRQKNDHARDERNRIEQADRSHDRHGNLVIERQTDLLVQHIDELCDRARTIPRDLQVPLGIEGRIPCLLRCTARAAFRPDGPAHTGWPVGARLDMDRVTHSGVGILRDGLTDEFLGLLQRDRRRQFGRWRSPAFQRPFEHGDRAGIEGDKQGKARDDAHPGVNILVHLHDVGADHAAPPRKVFTANSAAKDRSVAPPSHTQARRPVRNRKQKPSTSAQTGDISHILSCVLPEECISPPGQSQANSPVSDRARAKPRISPAEALQNQFRLE